MGGKQSMVILSILHVRPSDRACDSTDTVSEFHLFTQKWRADEFGAGWVEVKLIWRLTEKKQI